MSFRWPTKDPDETLDYSIDWSRFLGSATITGVTWFVQTPEIGKTQINGGQTLTVASSNAVTDNLQNIAQTNTTTVATINLGAGVRNRKYIFTCRIVDSTGSTSERTAHLTIREN